MDVIKCGGSGEEALGRKNINQSMTERRAMRFLILFSAFIFLFIDICRADTLQLMDGRTLKGRIVQEDGDPIIFQEEGGRMNNFFRDQVVNIIRGDAVPINVDPKQFSGIEPDKVGYILRLMEANGTRASLSRICVVRSKMRLQIVKTSLPNYSI